MMYDQIWEDTIFMMPVSVMVAPPVVGIVVIAEARSS